MISREEYERIGPLLRQTVADVSEQIRGAHSDAAIRMAILETVACDVIHASGYGPEIVDPFADALRKALS